MTGRSAIRGAGLAALAGIAAAVALSWSIAPARGASAAVPAVILNVTGSVHGFLDVCGCETFPLGSLARRAAHMNASQRRWPTAATFAVDAGDFSDLPGPSGEVKTRALVEAMNELGYRAAGIGQRDLAFGPAALLELGRLARFPFLSANLVRTGQATPWLPATQVVEAGGLRIAIVAAMNHDPIASWTLPDGSTLVTIDPLPAVERAMKGLQGKIDVVVLLASMPLEDARLLAQRVPGIDLVFGSYGGRATLAPVLEGGTRILYLEDEGKFLGQATIFRSGEPGGRPTVEVSRHQLGADVGSDARWESYTVEAMARAQQADDDAQRRASPPPEARYTGAGACAGCHLSIVEQWSKTSHAEAWRTLVRAGKKAQPSCTPCHVTGHGQAGGFIDERTTPHLAGVGCEACHGPAAQHLSDPARPYGRTSLASCTSCHTAEQDPTFSYYQDRQRVMHGSPPP